jgi:hypothetical protein
MKNQAKQMKNLNDYPIEKIEGWAIVVKFPDTEVINGWDMPDTFEYEGVTYKYHILDPKKNWVYYAE